MIPSLKWKEFDKTVSDTIACKPERVQFIKRDTTVAAIFVYNCVTPLISGELI